MIYLSFFNSSEGIVYNVDEMTGGLVISHRLRLPTRDYPGIFQLTSCQCGTYSTDRKSASICFLLLRLPSCLFTHYHFEKKWSNQSL